MIVNKLRKPYLKYSNKSRRFNLFFKLLFLLPQADIKLLHKLLLLIKGLSYTCKRNLKITIYKKFHLFYKKYLFRFLKIRRTKKLKSN